MYSAGADHGLPQHPERLSFRRLRSCGWGLDHAGQVIATCASVDVHRLGMNKIFPRQGIAQTRAEAEHGVQTHTPIDDRSTGVGASRDAPTITRLTCHVASKVPDWTQPPQQKRIAQGRPHQQNALLRRGRFHKRQGNTSLCDPHPFQPGLKKLARSFKLDAHSSCCSWQPSAGKLPTALCILAIAIASQVQACCHWHRLERAGTCACVWGGRAWCQGGCASCAA